MTVVLTPRGRRLARELDDAIREGNIRRVLALVDGYSGGRAERLAVATVLDHQPTGEEVSLRFDRFDRAHVRTMTDVWAHGSAA